jgi:hypothetical protein
LSVSKQNKLLKLGFVVLSILFLFHLFLKTNLYPRDYTFTEWFINYEGGFVKRGLGGQIALEISNLTKINLKLSILLIQSFGYITFFYYFYKSIKNINLNFFWYLVLLSPTLLIYPIVELEALGRKDIFVITFFLIFSLLNEKNKESIIRNFIIIFLLSTLMHEITVFYIFHYLFIIFLKTKNLKKEITFQNLFWIFLFVSSLIFLNMHVNKFSNLDKMIEIYSAYGLNVNIDITTESGSISWLKQSFRDIFFFTLDKINLISITRYALVYFLFLFPFVFFLRINKKTKNSKNIQFIVILLFLITIPMHLLVYDWGRIIYISNNFFTITIIAAFNSKLINIRIINLKIKNLKKNIKILFFLICCFLLVPKLTVTENLSTLPYVKITLKTIKEIIKRTSYENKFKNLNNKIKINVN